MNESEVKKSLLLITSASMITF